MPKAPLPRCVIPPLLARAAQGRSQYRHEIGGSPRLRGADCPNCRRPLPRFLSLDPADPRLGPLRLPPVTEVLYCFRCEIVADDLDYRITDNAIEILRYTAGFVELDGEWMREIGDVVPSIPIELYPAGEAFDRATREMNASQTTWDDWVPAETEAAYRRALGWPATATVMAGNQVGGEPLLSQGASSQACNGCHRQMAYLASVSNDKHSNLWMMPREYVHQLLAFYCEDCAMVRVLNRL